MENRALRRTSAAWPQGCTPHPEHLQEQQQGENRVKSMLFHMSGEGALLTTCSKRRSPPGADVPVEWICRHRAQPNSSHILPPQGHLGAAVAFGRGPLAGKHYQPAAAGARFLLLLIAFQGRRGF